MPAALHAPMFGFTCLAFLFVCVVIAIGTWVVFRSGEKGTTKLGGFAGCMIGLGLFGIAGLMALGTGLVMALNSWSEAVRHGPVKAFEFHFDDGSNTKGSRPDPKTSEETPGGEASTEDHEAGQAPTGGMDDRPSGRARIELVFLLRDESAVQDIMSWVREHIDADLASSWETVTTDEGEFTRLTIGSDLDPEEVRKARADLEEDFPGFQLPSGGKIELREPDH